VRVDADHHRHAGAFLEGGQKTPGRAGRLWAGQTSVEPLPVGAGRTAQPFLSQPDGGSGGCGATRRHPGTLRLQPQGSYRPSISRRRVGGLGLGGGAADRLHEDVLGAASTGRLRTSEVGGARGRGPARARRRRAAGHRARTGVQRHPVVDGTAGAWRDEAVSPARRRFPCDQRGGRADLRAGRVSLASDPGVPAPAAFGDYERVLFVLAGKSYVLLLNSSPGEVDLG